jgi:hypothetical protein
LCTEKQVSPELLAGHSIHTIISGPQPFQAQHFSTLRLVAKLVRGEVDATLRDRLKRRRTSAQRFGCQRLHVLLKREGYANAPIEAISAIGACSPAPLRARCLESASAHRLSSRYSKLLHLVPFPQQGLEPAGTRTSAGPGLRFVCRILVFWSDLSPFEGALARTNRSCRPAANIPADPSKLPFKNFHLRGRTSLDESFCLIA